MSDITVLVIAIVGGLAGITVVGVAFWMMRQEEAAKPDAAPAHNPPDSAAITPTETVTPPAEATPSTPADTPAPLPGGDSGWMSQLREAAPPLPPVPDATLATDPPAPILPPLEVPRPAPAAPAQSSGWLGSLASRVSGPATPPAPPAQELMRLLRTPEGDLVVEVYGRRYRTRAEITDAPVEQQVKNASNNLNQFLADTLNQVVKAVPPTALAPVSISSRKEANDNRPVVKVSLQEAAQMEVKRPSMDIVTQFRYVRSQQGKPIIQIKSVMDEIDEILQVMVIGTPFSARGLKASDGSHGAVFSLDGKNYDSVDALPDTEAREMVRTAIQKWDQK